MFQKDRVQPPTRSVLPQSDRICRHCRDHIRGLATELGQRSRHRPGGSDRFTSLSSICWRLHRTLIIIYFHMHVSTVIKLMCRSSLCLSFFAMNWGRSFRTPSFLANHRRVTKRGAFLLRVQDMYDNGFKQITGLDISDARKPGRRGFFVTDYLAYAKLHGPFIPSAVLKHR